MRKGTKRVYVEREFTVRVRVCVDVPIPLPEDQIHFRVDSLSLYATDPEGKGLLGTTIPGHHILSQSMKKPD